MTESTERVREIAKSLRATIPEERLTGLLQAYEANIAEAEQCRPAETPQPRPTAFDASWSERK